jgi:sialate O-acetylesterase
LPITPSGLRVGFDFAAELATSDGRPIRGFQLRDADGTWHDASATASGSGVLVESPSISMPRAVRSAWAPNPDANLINGAGLPASPFTAPAPMAPVVGPDG